MIFNLGVEYLFMGLSGMMFMDIVKEKVLE